ncbi:MAG TPA: ATP-binding protein [Burkholderiales bacterium]|nr:ATP-binding protein [Burkholderiales bacterium]
MKLRSHLIVLIAATLLPMALFAIGGAYLLAERERSAFQRGASERVRALMTAVDAELRGSITTLEALAALAVFDGDNPERFRDEAARIVRTQPHWLNIVVSRPSGEPVFNLLARPGQAPASPDPQAVQRVAREQRAIVNYLTGGPVIKTGVIAVRSPVVRNGQVKHVVTAVVDPALMKRLLDQQRFPPDWPAAVVDERFHFVARNPDPPGGGLEISTSLRSALASTNEGWQEGRLLGDQAIYRAFIRSPQTGWSTSVAIPKAVVDRSGVQAAWLLGLGVLLAMAAGVALAALLARRIAVPIAQLAAAAPHLGEPGAIRIPDDSSVTEVRHLASALRDAGLNIREREARQQEAERALRAADRAKDEFLAMLGHELRNPLATLTTAAELLKVARNQPGVIDNAQALIARQTQQMAHLVDDLLEVSRVTGGKIRLEREPLNVADVAAKVLAAWRATGRLARHHVAEALEPAWIDGDAARVEQIIINLVDNAVKYTPRGGHIWLAVRLEAGQVLIEVRDDGEGVAPELAGRMFDLFVQGERSLARQQGGLGIGLTLVRRLAELHGGSASAESPGPGQGTTFAVRLPPVAARTAAAAVRASPPQRVSARILIVEDNEDARTSLARLLALSGHSVDTAENAAAGLAAAARGEHDVALLDIGLPDLDGYELARRLRRTPGGDKLRLIALTGYGRDEDRATALEAGFDEHLTKPVALERLERVLEAFSSERSSTRGQLRQTP